MDIGTVLVRADASIAMGTGHVMRCLALAQAWQDLGGRVVFAMTEVTPSVQARLRSEDASLIQFSGTAGTLDDARQTVDSASKYQAKWVVVDGYQFGTDYQRALADSGLKSLFVDDNGHCDYYSANVVLNQNVYADEAAYVKRATHTKLLLGLRYAMLRREYSNMQAWQRFVPEVARKVLITMGGSDPMNLSVRILRALPNISIEGFATKLVIGGSNPHRELLEENVARISAHVELLHDVQNMAEPIAWADVAVAAAGTVSWEICALGLPSLLIPVAENQLNAASALGQHGAARILPTDAGPDQIAESIRELMLSRSTRETIAGNARALLDAQGARRVVAAMLASDN